IVFRSIFFFFFSSRRRHTRFSRDWSSDVCSSDLSTGFLMVLGFVSENGEMDRTDIADYVTANLVDPTSRVQGVGTVQVFGAQYRSEERRVGKEGRARWRTSQ